MKRILYLLSVLFTLSSALNGQWISCNNGMVGSGVKSLLSTRSAVFCGATSGIYRSDNDGVFWKALNPTQYIASANVLMFIDTVFYAGNYLGVHTSIDSGLTWQQRNNGLKSTFINCLALVDTVLFAGTSSGMFSSTDKGNQWKEVPTFQSTRVSVMKTLGNRIVVGTTKGVFLSQDKGQTWTEINGDLGIKDVRALHITSTYILAGFYSGIGIYKSTNLGTSWVKSQNYLAGGSYLAFLQKGSKIYASEINDLSLSSDNGDSWQKVHDGISSQDISSLCYTSNRLFAGTTAGVFVASEPTLTWSYASEGIKSPVITSLSASKTHLLAATYNGAFVSTNQGDEWSSKASGLSQRMSYASCVLPDRYLLGTITGVYSNSLNGSLWSPTNDGIASYDIRSLTFGGGLVYTGTSRGVCLSHDNGASWESASVGITPLARCVVAVKDSLVYAGVEGGGMFMSRDSAKNWIAINTSFTSTLPQAIAFMGDVVVVGTKDKGIFVSLDRGAKWSVQNTGLSGMNVFSLVTKDNYVFAGLVGGLYVSKDSGQHWFKAPSGGYPLTNIYAMAIQEDRIYACAAATGVYRALIDELVNPIVRISSVDNISIRENGQAEIQIEVSAPDLSTLTFSKSSSNQQLVPLDSIKLPTTSATMLVRIIPTKNVFGNSTIGITVSNGVDSATTRFVLTVQKADGVSNNIDMLETHAYPNPATDYVQLEGALFDGRVVQYWLYNSLGEIVRRGELSTSHGSAILTRDFLSRGVYCCVLKTMSSQSIVRFVW